MLDLFGREVHLDRKVRFSEAEIDDMLDFLVLDGEILQHSGEMLARLKRWSTSDPESTEIPGVRKEGWKELLWIYALDEPSPVSFDDACTSAGADAEAMRNRLSVEFASELRLLLSVLAARIPHRCSEINRTLRRYINVRVH